MGEAERSEESETAEVAGSFELVNADHSGVLRT